MGLFDQLVGGVLSQLGSENTKGLLEAAGEMIESRGGLAGLVEQFQQAGLGEQAESWVGTGDNMSLSAQDLVNALGGDQLAGLASRLGLSEDQISGGLSELLPQIVDQLTPQGDVPEGSDLIQEGLRSLAGKWLS
jgi:uncharacterized protein YidB (DUF937 family)